MASEHISSCTSGTVATAVVAALSADPAVGADVEGEVTVPTEAEAMDSVVGLVFDGTSFALFCFALWAAARALLRFCCEGVLCRGWWW